MGAHLHTDPSDDAQAAVEGARSGYHHLPVPAHVEADGLLGTGSAALRLPLCWGLLARGHIDGATAETRP